MSFTFYPNISVMLISLILCSVCVFVIALSSRGWLFPPAVRCCRPVKMFNSLNQNIILCGAFSDGTGIL